MKRGSGILMHISSFPTKYGIGTMGKEAYEFVDFLQRSGQKYWQILPIGPTSYGDSPYQSFSTFAGNPYFIDFDALREDGSLRFEDYSSLDWGSDPERVDYSKIFENRFKVLRIAYENDKKRKRDEIQKFRVENSYWIENYSMFMALKFDNNLRMYRDWDEDIVLRKPEAIIKVYNKLDEEISFWVYVQYQFYKQWNALKAYANKQDIKIIGDIPIYVAEDSADAWSHNEVLMLNPDRTPVKVAGCPPDGYAPKGQLWGNPLYNWDYLASTGYEWWIKRLSAALNMYDVVRVDHFRAFDAFYAIEYGKPDAVEGEWLKGPGNDFFNAVKREFGESPSLIAEDLGTITDDVRALLKYSGFPGMKVMQFGFYPGSNSDYLPHNYGHNSVVYIGTHDNDTLKGWFESQSKETQEFTVDYLRLNEEEGYNWGFIKSMLACTADTAIITMQDILNLGSDARMNTPSTMGANWQWRLKDMTPFTDELAAKLLKLTKLYSR
ncbi:MAG: 4-alpha-glucanotransferase [Clostridiales bacterium]|nr:4-alpha-glucanotransferase [Clostridiales bacterium]